MSTAEESEHDFPFEAGDTVLVRVRENGTRGNIVAKFEAECVDISPGVMGTSATARFDLPWGRRERTKLSPYEAEFEVVG